MTQTPELLYALAVIGAMAVSTVITRCGFLLFGDRIPLSPSVRQALRYAPVAALTAIIVPELAPWHPEAGPVLDWRMAAGLAVIPVFLRTRSITLSMVVGMAVLWGGRWLTG